MRSKLTDSPTLKRPSGLLRRFSYFVRHRICHAHLLRWRPVDLTVSRLIVYALDNSLGYRAASRCLWSATRAQMARRPTSSRGRRSRPAAFGDNLDFIRYSVLSTQVVGGCARYLAVGGRIVYALDASDRNGRLAAVIGAVTFAGGLEVVVGGFYHAISDSFDWRIV